MLSPHEILGIPVDASGDEIRRAYRIKAQLLHPDRHATAPAEVQEAAAEEFRRVAVAYETLSNALSGSGQQQSPGGSSSRPAADQQSTDDDGFPEGTFYGASAADLVRLMVLRAAEAHPEYEISPELIHSYAERVIDGACAQFGTVELPSGWGGVQAVGIAHAALCGYMDRVAATLAYTPWVDRDNSLYLIAFNACGLLNHVTEPPPGLPKPVPLAARASAQTSRSSPSSRAGRVERERFGAGRAFAVVAAILGLIVLVLSIIGGQMNQRSVSSTGTAQVRSSTTAAAPTWGLGGCVKPVAGSPQLLESTSCSGFHTGRIIAKEESPEYCPPSTSSYVQDRGFTFCIFES